MIINLFSIFDPSIFLLKIFPWFFSFVVIIFLITGKFELSKNFIVIKMILLPLSKELKSLLGRNLKKGNIFLILILFLTIFIVNFFALFPFIFTPSAHIMITFPISFVFWISFIIFGWYNNSKNILSHLVPMGTPLVLINFMVLIELVSNIIRPITLSVRLCANIVAGHLLLRLLRNFSLNSLIYFYYSLRGLLILGVLEIAVALIQGYVFITLVSLYSTEIH